MAEPRILTADRGDAGRRVDLVLRRHLTDVASATRTRVQAWIEDGRVTVNGVAVRRVAARAAYGDAIAVAIPDRDDTRRLPPGAEAVEIDILFEDEHLLAVNKPAGMVAHPAYKNATGTLLNALLWHARTWPPTHRPSLAGRLDRLTSGVVIVAKTAAVHASLQRAMALSVRRPDGLDATGAEKEYLAVVYGRMNVVRGRIDLRIGRKAGDRRKVVASRDAGAASLTYFERVARVAAPRAGLSLVRCRLATGRTHQIRVHLAARGWPIVGDPAYGEPRWSRILDGALAATLRAFPRQALHASRVTFTHPVTRERVTVVAPIPRDFQELVTATGLGQI